MYSEILIDEVFEGYKMADGDAMQNLSRINVLIGKNNSGKSRFMRALFSSEKILFNNSKYDDSQIIAEFQQIKWAGSSASQKLQRNGWGTISGLQKIAEAELKDFWRVPDRLMTAITIIKTLQKEYRINGNGSGEFNLVRNELSHHIDKFLSLVENAEKYTTGLKRIYLPTLRGLRPLQFSISKKEDKEEMSYDNRTDNYLKRTESDYFKTEIKNSRIITGLHLYEETKKLLLGSLAARKKVRDFENFISETFFEGQEFSITPNIDDDVLHVRIGPNEKDEKPIHALGDGIQAIIILTYPLFFHEGEHTVICYEEPETHLHPGLQRLFVETLLLPRFESFQYFFTTHSNHFLDLTADYDKISVYTFSKKEDEPEETFVIENVENGDGNVLQLIGARASSVFLSNCTIWVEGITDRLYLRKYLEVFQEDKAIKYKEDYHYSFVEYGGNNITHWSFLDADDPEHLPINVERLCAKLFLITDKDGAELKEDGSAYKEPSKKYRRHQQLKEKLGARYYCLQCREIENLLTKEVLKVTIAKREKNTGLDFTQFDKATNYEGAKLGAFIEDKLKGLTRKWVDRGALNDKLGFCKLAIEEIKDVNDLADEARLLTEKLYDFIAQHN